MVRAIQYLGKSFTNLVFSISLNFVPREVWHSGHVVADVGADVNFDWFAHSVSFGDITGTSSNPEKTENGQELPDRIKPHPKLRLLTLSSEAEEIKNANNNKTPEDGRCDRATTINV